MAYFLGIAGTHSTGKSTFIEEVERQAESQGIVVRRISDTATKCRDIGLPILRDHTFESTLWIMVTVIKAEIEAGMGAELVLVDRPVIDALGYLEAALKATHRSITAQERDYLYGLAKLHNQRYALLLKTKLNDAIPLGPDRDLDLEFRRSAAQEIDQAFNYLNAASLDPNAAGTSNQIQSIFDKILAERRG